MFSAGKGGKAPVAQIDKLVNSLRISTSAYGQTHVLVFGTNRVPLKLLDYQDFRAIPHTSTEHVGGKGGGGQDVTNTTYTYQAAVMLAACEGGIYAITGLWDVKGKVTLNGVLEQYTLQAAAPYPKITVAQAAAFKYDNGCAFVTTQNVWVQDSPDSGHWKTVTQNTPLRRQQPVAGVMQHGTYWPNPSVAGEYWFSSEDVGKVVAISYNEGVAPLSQYGLTVFTGDRTQTPWAYMLTKHASRALAYRGLAYLANEAMNLGESGELPQLSVEVAGLCIADGLTKDANAADIITRLLTDPYFGAKFPAAKLGDLTALRTHCDASGLYLSPTLDGQQQTSDILTDLLDCVNAAPVWSAGTLKFIPYVDITEAANGAVYVPDTTPKYDLTDDDFLGDPKRPIIVRDKDVRDAYNQVTIEYLNRANGYNTDIVTADDKAHIEQYGLRPEDVKALHAITEQSVALAVASTRLKRFVYIDPVTYLFKVGWKYVRLEPMDLVTLTDANLGFDKLPVRIKTIEEDDSGVLAIEAEPFPFGTATATLYPKQSSNPYAPNTRVEPGNARVPIVFETPDALSQNAGKYEVRIAACGEDAENWGGCTVWVSEDDLTYRAIGRITAPARMGHTTNGIDAVIQTGGDPADENLDNLSELGVDLTDSAATLLSGTDADRDAARTLCFISDGDVSEFFSYRDAQLIGANAYTLSSLRRGLYGSSNYQHVANKPFVRVDDSLFVTTFDSSLVGKTLYLKLTSFNKFGLSEQSLADVTAHQFALLGAFNNFTQIVANDAIVASQGEGAQPYATAKVSVYGRVNGIPTPNAAITLKKSDGTTRQTPAVEFTGKAISTVYYALMNPRSGLKYLLTSYSAMASAVYNGHISFGSTTTPDAGGAGGEEGGGGGGYGGGSGDYCPIAEMYLDADNRAGDVVIGQMLDCIDPLTSETFEAPVLRRTKGLKRVRCVHLVAENGAEFGCSADTPFTLQDGRSVKAENMNGELVATDSGKGTPVEWSRVRVSNIGTHEVVAIDLGGRTFAAGMKRDGKRMYSHNMAKAPLYNPN